MRWTIVIVAIFVLFAMVTSNAIYDKDMEEVNPWGDNMFPNGVQVVADSTNGPTINKRWWHDWRRDRHEEEHRWW
ncbi:unnamed protein product [Adineta steineri]|uniref:Uncharacterized protein n=1 Tax=Adineta steineri TaxID=433720 RepID=A0A819H874_9BILA|nr:unnamed protein product [Adineta steineri]CAF3893338.1 unnamed protein product [Adineta steineri]